MRKANARGQGRGRGNATAGSSRRHLSEDTARVGEGRPALRSSGIPCFVGQLRRGGGTQLTDTEQCEQVLQWIADSASTHFSSTTQSSAHSSLPASQESDLPSSKPAQLAHGQRSHPTFAHSEELFSGPCPLESQELPEDLTCSDAQNMDPLPSPVDLVVVGRQTEVTMSDDDETQLPLTQGVEMESVQEEEEEQIEELEEEVLDDETTDPPYLGEMSSGESSGGAEGRAAPKRGRGRGICRGRGQRRQDRPTRAEAVPGSSQSRQTPPAKLRTSLVWNFFNVCADDNLSAVCSLCHSKISRGSKKSNLTTSGMLHHLKAKHWAQWERANAGEPSPCVAAAASSPVCSAGATLPSTSHDSSPSAGASDTLGTPPSPSPVRAPSPVPSCASSHQMSIAQAFDRRRKYASNHPQAQLLNCNISKLLALEMLPFRLVETQAFRNLMAAAAPRYSVPSRHYFSRCAVPALSQHVSRNIRQALSYAVSAKVHLTTDAWSSACGQGRYISLTAHWVNVVEAGTDARPGLASILHPPKISSTGYNNPSSSSSSSSSSLSSPTPSSAASWKRCSTGVGRRQQAVLKLISLGDRKHTAPEVKAAILQQAEVWLSPLQLGPGMVVCDNGRNLVAALELAELQHVPCLAHVFNLVVQRFLKTYPDMAELLVKVRRMCAHFRKSTVAAASLKKIQQHLHLPEHRLLCDVSTRWNSTYHMLARVCEQQQALREYMLQNTRVPSTQLPQFANHEWPWMADICEVLRIFEESTKKVSCDDATVSLTIPLLCVVRESLIDIRENALRAEEDRIGGDVTQRDSHHALLSTSRRRFLEEEEEEEEEEEGEAVVEASGAVTCVPLVRRGWGEQEPELELEEEEEEEELERGPSGGGSEVMPIHSLAHMADIMGCCFARDKRVVHIMGSKQYWVFAILDPRYKDNISLFIPVEERATRLLEYQRELLQDMMEIFPPSITGGREESSSRTPTTSTGSTAARGTLSKVWDTLMAPPRQTSITAGPTVNRREKYRRMLREYLADCNPVLPEPSAPYNYWVSKLDTWLELSLYALEVLACPAASVLSERVFSAAGGIITDKRSRLSTESADRLTLIKMNSHWIDPDFASPPVQSSTD